MKIWLDDLRHPPDDSWIWVKSVDSAVCVWIAGLSVGGSVEIASLDHDLGGLGDSSDGRTGYDFVCWLEGRNLWPRRLIVHSQNPVGARRMATVAARYTSVILAPFIPKGDD